MRMFGHMPGMACGQMMQMRVFRLVRQRSGHHAGQQRADNHAERRWRDSPANCAGMNGSSGPNIRMASHTDRPQKIAASAPWLVERFQIDAGQPAARRP